MNRQKKKTAQSVEGRTSLYNPLLQKPIALHPVGPGSYPSGYGGYAYIGPPPDFGGTYGKFMDTAGREQVGIKSSKMFSIYDGSPTQFQAELSQDEREALLSQMEAAFAEYKCESCRSELAISAVRKMDDVFCPHCGTGMSGAAEKVKQCVSTLEELKMGGEKNTIEAKAKKSKANVDIAKEAMKKDAPGQGQDLKPEAAELKDHADAQKGIEKCEPMKELAKDLVKANSDEKAQILAKKKERMKAAVKAYREKRKAKLQAEAEATPVTPAAAPAPVAETTPAPVAPVAEAAPVTPAAPVPAVAKTEEEMKVRRELRIMAALDPDKFAKAKKNPKLAAICAEVETKIVSKVDRIKVRAELKVLAAEDAVAAEELAKQLDFIAPEILMEEEIVEPKEEGKEHEDKAAESASEEHPTLKADEAAPVAPEHKEEPKKEEAAGEGEEVVEDGALSMQTEFLASLDTLRGEKVEMSLYNEQTQNPFWNVIVDGEPVGRVYMQDQAVDNVEDIRAAFCSEGYANNFGAAASSPQIGLKKLLTITKAKLFAHNVDDAEVTARLREKAKLEAKAEMDEKITTLRADFMKAVSLAMVAADKNFYQEEAGHKLKEGLFNSLIQAGLNEDGAVWAIEAGFEHSNDYFEFLMAKAQEIMDMPQAAREAIEKQILGSGKMQISVEAPEEETLADRLVKSSVKVIANGGQISGEHREQIRSQLGLSANRK